MRRLVLLTLMLGVAACGGDHEPHHTAITQATDCTKIVPSVERLACFDTVAGTPIPRLAKNTATLPPVTDGKPGTTMSPHIVELVRRNEAQRKAENSRFLLSLTREGPSPASQVVISAPALGSEAPRPLLAISCLSGITRFQLIMHQPIPLNRLHMLLLMDGKPVAGATIWQVLASGNIADAGRGLVAIDTLKHMPSGSRLQTESDYPPLDGLLFDATDLHELLAQQREACHW